MKTIKKLTALLLVVLMLSLAAGCSTKAEWSYKTADKELPIGVYIYSMYASYSQAQSLASELEEYDSEKSFLNLEIQDEDDDAPLRADEWIVNNAKEMCRTMLAVETECKARGVELSAETLSGIEAAAKSDWTLGPNYQMYVSMGYTPASYESLLHPFGVSYDSFKYGYYLANQMQYELFLNMYKEGGERAVSDDELKEFFDTNYTNYEYFTVSLTKSEEDEDGNSAAVAMTDDEKQEVIDKMQEYVDAVNNGKKTWDEVIEEYMEAEELESDPSAANTEILEKSSLNDDVKTALEALAEGKADLVEVGSDTSAVLYVVYKAPIADAEESNLEDENAAEAVLVQYKTDEFSDFLQEAAANVSVTENTSAVGKYKPSMFEK